MQRWISGISIFLLGFGALAPEVMAQDSTAGYEVGDHVEVKPTTWQNIWEEGVVTGISYDHTQLIIKSPIAGERGFVMKDVRHLGGAKAADVQQAAPQAAPRYVAAPAPQQGARNGERVSVAVGGACCYAGTIIGTGTGSLAGMYLIHFDNPASQDQYAQAKYIYPRGTAARAAPVRRGNGSGCQIMTIGYKPVCRPH